MCAGVAYANWCRPIAMDCLPLLPIWGFSGLILFGVAVVPAEVLLVVAFRKNMTLRRLLEPRYVVAVFLCQGILGGVLGEVLALRFGPGGP